MAAIPRFTYGATGGRQQLQSLHRLGRVSLFIWTPQDMEAPVVCCEFPNHQKLALKPVMSMQQVGTQNATNLITAPNDGRLCVRFLHLVPASTVT